MVKTARRATYVPVTRVRNPSRSNASIYVQWNEMPGYMSDDECKMDHVMSHTE